MNEQVENWTPLTMWNVGKINGKQMITFPDGFSTHVRRCAWQNEVPSRPVPPPPAPHPRPEPISIVRDREQRWRRRPRLTVEEVLQRYNI